eukprot:4732337-Pyramimonas_sp.AAC.1
MIKHGLLTDDSESPMLMREIEEFKTKIEGSALITYLLDLPTFPKRMAIRDDEDSGMTILGRCRQFVRARPRVGLGAPDAKP